MQAELPLEFVVNGTPVSLQASARSRTNWKRTVETAASKSFSFDTWLVEDPLAVTIFHFHRDERPADLDNIVKPILDAMVRVVYVDDEQVERLVVQRFDSVARDGIIDPSPTLIGAMDASADAVYILITRVPLEVSA